MDALAPICFVPPPRASGTRGQRNRTEDELQLLDGSDPRLEDELIRERTLPATMLGV